MPSTAADPLLSCWFTIEVQGTITGAFSEVSGLGSETEVVEVKAVDPQGQQYVKKVPGRLKWGDITLKRGITSAMDVWQWRKAVEQGNIASNRKNGSIVMYDQHNSEVARWNFVNAWPSKVTGPSINAETGQVAIEEMTLVHEGIERVS